MEFKYGTRVCPKCESSWDGGSIVDEFIEQRDKGASIWKGMTDEQVSDWVKERYSEPYVWGRELGIELPYDHPNHYDGTSYIQCPDCKTTWDIFTGKEVS